MRLNKKRRFGFLFGLNESRKPRKQVDKTGISGIIVTSNEDRDMNTEYPKYKTPDYILFCLNTLSKCRKIRRERIEVQRAITNRHGKLK